jgi:hypothetical protein
MASARAVSPSVRPHAYRAPYLGEGIRRQVVGDRRVAGEQVRQPGQRGVMTLEESGERGAVAGHRHPPPSRLLG